jgi:hypothetical protein
MAQYEPKSVSMAVTAQANLITGDFGAASAEKLERYYDFEPVSDALCFSPGASKGRSAKPKWV